MHSAGNGHKAAQPADALLSAYFTASAKGTGHRKRIAMQSWSLLSPTEKIGWQQEARAIAGDNLELSAEYTQAALLLEYVNQQAAAQGTPPSSPLFEAFDPTASDGAASALPPVT